jgi:hypothetical protein
MSCQLFVSLLFSPNHVFLVISIRFANRSYIVIAVRAKVVPKEELWTLLMDNNNSGFFCEGKMYEAI